MKKTYLFTFSVLSFYANWLFAQQEVPQKAIELRTIFISEPVLIKQKPTIYYELSVSNHAADSLSLIALDVLDKTTGSPLLSLSKAELAKRFEKTGNSSSARIAPGDTAIVYIELALNVHGTPLVHRLRYQSGTKAAEVLTDGTAASPIPDQATILLGKPLAGGPWAAIYEPAWSRGHRRVRYLTNGVTKIPGRYAIDFMLLDSLGRFANGDTNDITNYFGYGAKVLAVADGTVIALRKDFSESPTLDQHPAYAAADATGNYICLQIAEKRYVFYEHLKPGSIHVTVGQQVKKGETIAEVGFTGQTTGPHLHLHVADAISPLGSEGLPFAFETFELSGHYPDFSKFGLEPWVSDSAQQAVRHHERPAPNTVITFSP